MSPTVTPNNAKAATSGMVISLPSIKNLLTFISTVPGLLPHQLKPGTVGLPCYRSVPLPFRFGLFTMVKALLARVIESLIDANLRISSFNYCVVLPEFDPVNISGKCPGNAGPNPAKNAVLDFYRLLIPDTALKEIRRALQLIWHWLVFPVALCCKVRPLISCLL